MTRIATWVILLPGRDSSGCGIASSGGGFGQPIRVDSTFMVSDFGFWLWFWMMRGGGTDSCHPAILFAWPKISWLCPVDIGGFATAFVDLFPTTASSARCTFFL